jgi:hypothetical protein
MTVYSEGALSALLEQAKWGYPDPRAVAELARCLESGDLPAGQRYTALHIVARAGGPKYEALVARYLESPDQPMLARLALMALCEWMELAGKYKAELLRFMRWVSWDVGDDVRQIALSLAGNVVGQTGDAELLAALLEIAADTAELPITRDNAVRALAVALGEETESMPPATRVLDPDSDWATRIVQRARTAKFPVAKAPGA